VLGPFLAGESQREIDMNKITLLAIAVTGVFASAAFAEESTIPFGDGEAILISPNGTVHKSNTKVSATNHEAALAKGAKEISRGMVIYKHEGKLYSMNCVGSEIGGWEQGYPGTEDEC
jgi:hypothetical protein